MNVGAKGQVYHRQAAALTGYRTAVGLLARRAWRGRPLRSPAGVAVTVTFCLPQPATTTNPMPTGTTKGVYDLDKLVRACLDAMQGVVYENDSQVVELHARKCWGRPSTEVTVTEVPG